MLNFTFNNAARIVLCCDKKQLYCEHCLITTGTFYHDETDATSLPSGTQCHLSEDTLLYSATESANRKVIQKYISKSNMSQFVCLET